MKARLILVLVVLGVVLFVCGIVIGILARLVGWPVALVLLAGVVLIGGAVGYSELHHGHE